MKEEGLSEKMIKRARNDAFLHAYLKKAMYHNMSKEEAYEMIIHALLDLKDDMYQRELDKHINFIDPVCIIMNEKKEGQRKK